VCIMEDFWEHEAIPRGANAYFIALVPKKDNPQEVE